MHRLLLFHTPHASAPVRMVPPARGAPHRACPCRPPVSAAGCDGPRPCLGREAAMIPEAVRVEQGDTSEPGDLWPSLDAFVERTRMRALVIGTSKDPNAKITMLLFPRGDARPALAVKIPTTDEA